jgi:Amidohydrolase family
MRLDSLGPGLLLLAACAPNAATVDRTGAGEPAAIAIINATVIPMDTERTIPNAAVIVRGDRIVWAGPMRDAAIPANAQRVDAAGAFVLPGLADLHVHTEARDLPQYLANGVTTIREMNGSADHLALRERIRSGAVAGPTMHVAGTLLAGTRQRWRHQLVVTPDEGRAAVREQVQAGYEFIKVYDGLSAESYAAIIGEARARGVRVVGHVPAAVGLAGVLAARQSEIEHIDQIVRGVIYRDTTAWRARVDSIAGVIAASGTWVNPTLAVEEGLARTGTPWYSERLTSPEMRFVDSATMAWWTSLGRPRLADTARASAPRAVDEYGSPRARAVVEMKRATVASLRARGARMLVGSDVPNPLMVPGFAVHEELAALVRAGITPFDAIAMATRDAAQFVGGDRFGVVEPGTRADLLIVAGNPLADVSRLRQPTAVMVRGRWTRVP